MDNESQPGHNLREAQSEALRQLSACSIRASTTAAGGERMRCRRLRPLGVLMPLFLMPLLLLGPKYGGCLYCLLLPLLLCAFRTIPKPATALMHLVTIPVLGLLEPDIIAGQYLEFEVLIVAMLLFLVVVLDAWSEVVRSMAQLLCARLGLRRGPLFAGACACSFVGAWLFSSAVASVVVVYFLDRVLYTIGSEKMDQPPDNVLISSQQDSGGSLRSVPVVESSAAVEEDEALFDRLAQVVLTMKKPERPKVRVRKLVAQKCVPAKTATPASLQASGSVTPANPAADGPECVDSVSPGGKDNRRNKRFSSWRPKWFKKQGTTERQENSQAVTPQVTSSVCVDQPTNQQNALIDAHLRKHSQKMFQKGRGGGSNHCLKKCGEAPPRRPKRGRRSPTRLK